MIKTKEQFESINKSFILSVILCLINFLLIKFLPNIDFLNEKIIFIIVNFCIRIENFLICLFVANLAGVLIKFLVVKGKKHNEKQKDEIMNLKNLNKKVKIKSWDLNVPSNEIEYLLDDYFSKNFYEKHPALEYSFRNSYVYVKEEIKDLDIKLNCFFVITLDDFNPTIANSIEKGISNYIETNFKKIDYLELSVILILENGTKFFYRYLDVGHVREFDSCSLWAGIVKNDNKIYFSNIKCDYNDVEYNKLRKNVLKIFKIKK